MSTTERENSGVVTFSHDAETGMAEWFSPTDGKPLLTLHEPDFERAWEITRAIAEESKTAARVARVLMHRDVERYLSRLTGV